MNKFEIFYIHNNNTMGCSCSRELEMCFKNFCDGYDCCVAECIKIGNESIWINDNTPQQCNSSCIPYNYENTAYFPPETIKKNFCLTGGNVYNDESYNIYISTFFFIMCLTIIFCYGFHKKNDTTYLVNAELIEDNTDIRMARPVDSSDSEAEEALSVTVIQNGICDNEE